VGILVGKMGLHVPSGLGSNSNPGLGYNTCIQTQPDSAHVFS